MTSEILLKQINNLLNEPPKGAAAVSTVGDRKATITTIYQSTDVTRKQANDGKVTVGVGGNDQYDVISTDDVMETSSDDESFHPLDVATTTCSGDVSVTSSHEERNFTEELTSLDENIEKLQQSLKL